MKTISLLLLVLLSCITPVLKAQVNDRPASAQFYFGNEPLSAAITKPADFFGFEPGEWHIAPEAAVAYYKLLASQSDRFRLIPYGKTWEQRPLIAMIISHPDNLSRMEEIRKRHLAFSDPKASADAASEPVVVWQGFSVHGNEPSGANAAVLYAYFLAASTSAQTEHQLRNAIIVIDPVINPDGGARFATWVNSRRATTQANADANDAEHNEPWPRGRTNHYWFDLNRDWLPLVNPESRGRMELYKSWMPNVLTDHHEMGTNSTFFFQPGVPSRTNPVTPKQTIELTARIGNFHAAALDSIGSAYFTKESYDDYYYGKGSTYPDVQGGVGILFEQASSRGHRQESANGVLSFAFTIRNQLVTARSTLKAAVSMRKDLLEHQRWFFKSALDEAAKDPVQAWIFGEQEDPVSNARVVDLLLRHNIEVYELAKEISADGMVFKPKSSFVVPVIQPQYRLVKALFSRTLTFEDSLFYDISTWTLPLAADLPHAALDRKNATGLTGNRVVKTPDITPAASPDARAAFYLIPPGQNGYFRFLNMMLKAGTRVKVLQSSSTHLVQNVKKVFPAGTLQIGSGAVNFNYLKEAATTAAVEVFGIGTGLAEAGIDAGSPSALAVGRPSIALLVGEGVTVSEAGELWHLLDAVQGIQVTLLPVESLNTRSLRRYNRLLMPGGTYTGLAKAQFSALRDWIRDGGVLLAQTSALSVLQTNEIVKLEFSEAKYEAEKYQRYDRQPVAAGFQEVAGAIFEASIDPVHPLGWGYSDGKLSLFRDHNHVLKPANLKAANPVMYSGGAQQSGWVDPKILKLIQGSAGVAVHRSGSGRMILFADNPNFRSFFTGTNRMYLNALFFGDLIRQASAESTD